MQSHELTFCRQEKQFQQIFRQTEDRLPHSKVSWNYPKRMYLHAMLAIKFKNKIQSELVSLSEDVLIRVKTDSKLTQSPMRFDHPKQFVFKK